MIESMRKLILADDLNDDLNKIKLVEHNILKNADLKSTPERTYDFTYGKVLKVYDGDTITLAVIDCGKLVKYSMRLMGVDTPEIKGGTEETRKKAKEARDFVHEKIFDKIVEVNILNGKLDENGKIVKEKYGRLLGRIKIDGEDLSELLISKNYAKPYFGGTKE